MIFQMRKIIFGQLFFKAGLDFVFVARTGFTKKEKWKYSHQPVSNDCTNKYV